jgi:hypothetical protein
MIILFALIAVVVVGWVLIGPRILPGATPSPSADVTVLDGAWVRTGGAANAHLELSGGTYSLVGASESIGSGTAVLYQGELILSADPGCPDSVGRYEISPETLDGTGEGVMTLTLIEDACNRGTRAAAVGGEWAMSGSQ